MAAYPPHLQELIDALGRLPGIGPKSAQRIAFFLLRVERSEALQLATAVSEALEHVTTCRRCFNLAEGELCQICVDPTRDQSRICVVEEPRDVVAVERTREFRGTYHVLGGAIDPLQGIGPDRLRVEELTARVRDPEVREVIICTNPNLEGDATAGYLGRILERDGLAVSRLAQGLPVGGDLEYADEVTLGRAFEGRRVLEG